jgi:hypothetical protein
MTTTDRYRLALEAGCNERTILRWLGGEHVSQFTATSLAAAAARLGMSVPEAPPRIGAPEKE